MSTTYKKIVAHKISSDFRAITTVEQAILPSPKPDEIVIRNYYLGINASDINYTNGRYTRVKPPFDTGLESMGKVVAVGDKVTRFKVGDVAASLAYGSFAEYVIISDKQAILLPALRPEILTIPVSGLTASLALKYTGEMKKGETILVTAAAGGTGQFAVQLAKLAGNHVIGTCSSDDKVEFLKKLGCDRVINYKKEDLNSVLRKEYPKGIDIVYESVGGDTFEICVNNLAVFGRLIIIGMVSGYPSGSAWLGSKDSPSSAEQRPLPARLLGKSASIRGFFINHYTKYSPEALAELASLYQAGKLKLYVDPIPFKGLERVADAIDYLYQGKNIGKVVVDVSPEQSRNSKL